RLLQYNNFFRGASSAPLPYASSTTVVFDVQGDWCIRRITCCLCRFAGAYSFEKHTAHLRSRPGDRHPSTRRPLVKDHLTQPVSGRPEVFRLVHGGRKSMPFRTP
ncbi:unnamed protein product, partial [Ascophyllum nodosum]